MTAKTFTGAGLKFRFAGNVYYQIADWRKSTDHKILRYQIENRGHALVRSSSGDAIKITRLTSTDEREPYYGQLGGAYRYTFHPIETHEFNGCELEITNLMSGFAYFYPKRIEPLHLLLPNPPEMVASNYRDVTGASSYSRDTRKTGSLTPPEMSFFITSELFQTLAHWPWFGRALTAYDFIFTPTSKSCLVRVRMRSQNAFIDLVQEDRV